MVFEDCCETHWKQYVMAYSASIISEDYKRLPYRDKVFMIMVFLHLQSCEPCRGTYNSFLDIVAGEDYLTTDLNVGEIVKVIKNERNLEDVLRKK